MSNLRAVLADDEGPARNFLIDLLGKVDGLEVVGVAKNGREAMEIIRASRPDVAFLDLQMPETNGLEVVRNLEEEELPQIVFVTAFDEYAVQAFEINAVDYLLKPVELERVEAAVERVRSNLASESLMAGEKRKLNNVLSEYSQEFIRKIPVKRGDDIFLVDVDTVESIVAEAELLHIKSSKLGTFLINFRLKDLEKRLSPEKFFRLSRGTIINIDFVERINPMPGGTYLITMIDGNEHSSSRSQSKRLRAELLKL